jgi:hypothetical protein
MKEESPYKPEATLLCVESRSAIIVALIFAPKYLLVLKHPISRELGRKSDVPPNGCQISSDYPWLSFEKL